MDIYNWIINDWIIDIPNSNVDIPNSIRDIHNLRVYSLWTFQTEPKLLKSGLDKVIDWTEHHPFNLLRILETL